MSTLREQIDDALEDRNDWATRQSVFYEMRHGGLRRVAKPYPGAPDMHFPLIDASIDKHKPFFVQQIYATEQLAAFVSKKQQDAETTSATASWFDFKVKQESNFEREAISGIDALLQNGGCPMKVFWRASKKRLEFDACDPLHVIVPKHTEELQDADWLVHVLHLSEAQYRHNKNYEDGDDFVKSIIGKGSDESGSDDKEQTKTMREGITYGAENQIVLWEIYTRDPDDWCKIIVKTRSPLKFNEPVRPDFQMPYSEGVFKGGWLPFIKWRGEIKDKGYYAPRGLSEIQAPFEQALTKSWNFKHEWMDFFARPMFEQTPESTAGNTGNHKSVPGSIIPLGLKPSQPPPIPASLDQDMNMTRQLAEYRVQAPDFGILAQEGGHRTAREISEIAGQSGQGTDLRARVNRLDLGDTYRMAWAILLQYGKDSLFFILNGEAKQLDAAAIEDCYHIGPSGSADSWNKNQQSAKAWARYDKLKGNPYIKQDELTKSVLEVDESGLVNRLYQEPQDAQMAETEEQNMELLLMSGRFGAKVDPADDDKAHLQAIEQWFPVRMQEQPPLDPITAKLVFQHIQEHGNALHAKKDPMVRAIDHRMRPISGALLAISQPNVVPMQQPPQEATAQ